MNGGLGLAGGTRGRAPAGPYFHVVFTLPAALGALAYQNKARVYGLLLRAAAETPTTIAAKPKHLGAWIGVTAVLHSWGQTLDHHPHVRCIVTAGGIFFDGGRWIACRLGFFLPMRVLSRLFLKDLEEASCKITLSSDKHGRTQGPAISLYRSRQAVLRACSLAAEVVEATIICTTSK